MPRTLRAKVSLVYGSLVGIIVLLGVYSLVSMFEISRAIDSLIVTNYNSIRRLADMQDALTAQNEALLRFFSTGDADTLQSEFTAQAHRFAKTAEDERVTIVIPNEMEMIAEITATHDTFCALLPVLLAAESAPARQYYDARVHPQLDRVKAAIGELVVSNETALFARKEDAVQVVRHTTLMLTVLFLLATAIGVFAARTYTARLFRPLYEITQNLKAVRQGNLNRKSNVKSTDELGVLAAEFNNMTQRLAEFEQSTLGELLRERNRTFAIVRSITEPMVILDSDARVTLINQSFERLFGVTMDGSLGRHFLEMVRQSGLHEFSRVDYKAAAYTEQVVQIGLEKGTRFFNVMVTPLDYNGEVGPDAAIIVLYDITALKELDRQRGDFIATISHEFKTPLTSIVMGVDLLADGAMGAMNTDQTEIVGTLREDAQRLCNLVNDLLELSRMESPDTIYHCERHALRELLREPMRQFVPLAKKNGVTLKSTVPPDVWVRADAGKIVWVLNNLLSNAVKYTHTGDTIKVHAYAGGRDTITVAVADTGVGIPTEYLERIFDKYVQVNSYDLELRGSGLGLAVTRSIITAHGGRIWCESGEGRGSRFLFTLPAAPEGGDAG